MDLGPDDVVRPGDVLGRAVVARFERLAQPVDVDETYAFDRRRRGVDVPRDREVQHEQRPLPIRSPPVPAACPFP